MKKNFLFSLTAVVFLWLAWFIAYFIVKNEQLLPSVEDTFVALWELLKSVAFWRAFGNTLLRTLWAFLASFVFGCGLASLSALFSPLRAFFAPVISFLRTLPTMAIVLVLLLWTSPAVAPVIIAALILFPAFYAATLVGLDGAEGEYGELARAYQVSKGRRLFKMYLPLCAPSVLGQAGSIFSMGLKVTISGEVLSSTFRSLGGLMYEAKGNIAMPRLIALTLVAVLVGFALEGLCLLVKRLAVRWKS